MRKIYISTLFLLAGVSYTYAQCGMIDVPLSTRIQSSTAIFEGKVTDRISFWNSEHTHIYTANTIEVYKVFKGSITSNQVEIVTEGGMVGDALEMVHPSLALYQDEVGTFLAQPATAVNSPTVIPTNLKFETVASTEGYIKYDLSDQTASDVFNKYFDVKNQIYAAITNQTGAFKEVKHFDMAEIAASRSITAASISGFTPTTITAGTQSVLTINGSGFGATKGTVSFANADDGGATYVPVNPNGITAWSDAQITVKVPSHQNCVAGTGVIKVTPSGGSAVSSSGTLTVTYSQLTAYDGSGNENVLKLANLNGSGGYNLQYNNSFVANTAAAAAFDRAMETWRCATLRNFVHSGNTATTCNANDNPSSPYTTPQVNIVSFDATGCILGSGLLGKTFSYYTACCTSSCLWILDGMDIIFSSNASGGSWNFGPGATTGSKYDFESTALHELGHATLEGHVINTPKLMHWARNNATDVRTLDAAIDVACGNDVVTRSLVSNACGKTAHIKSTVSCATGITEAQTDNTVSIYPNPFDNNTTLHISNISSTVSLVMYDVLGKEVKRMVNIKDENVQINRDNLPDGIYFYQVRNTEQTIATGKIVLSNGK